MFVGVDCHWHFFIVINHHFFVTMAHRFKPFALTIGLFVLPTTTCTAQCPSMLWNDEFDGDALDTTKWTYQVGDGCDISQDLCGCKLLEYI